MEFLNYYFSQVEYMLQMPKSSIFKFLHGCDKTSVQLEVEKNLRSNFIINWPPKWRHHKLLSAYLEEVGAELLEPGPRDRGVEVDPLEQRVDLNAGLCWRRQGPLQNQNILFQFFF